MQKENGMGKENYLYIYIYIIKNNPEKVSCVAVSKVSWGCHGKNDGKNSRYVL